MTNMDIYILVYPLCEMWTLYKLKKKKKKKICGEEKIEIVRHV